MIFDTGVCFRIIRDLLKVNVAPMAIMQMLKLMCNPQQQRAATDIHSYMSTSSENLSLPSRGSRQQRANGKGKQLLGSSRLKDGRHWVAFHEWRMGLSVCVFSRVEMSNHIWQFKGLPFYMMCQLEQLKFF